MLTSSHQLSQLHVTKRERAYWLTDHRPQWEESIKTCVKRLSPRQQNNESEKGRALSVNNTGLKVKDEITRRTDRLVSTGGEGAGLKHEASLTSQLAR